MDKSKLFKAAHALTRKTLRFGDNYQATFALCLKAVIADSKTTKTFTQGSPKQNKWATDAYNHYAPMVIEGINDLKTHKETTLKKMLVEALITSGYGNIRKVTNQDELDALCDDMVAELDKMMFKDWINFDDCRNKSDVRGNALNLYRDIFDNLKNA